MTNTTLFLLLIAVIIAAVLAFYQYLFQVKKPSKTIYFLAILRFLVWFAVFVLLINPIISRKSVEIHKTPLPIFLDNSASIVDLKAQNQINLYQKISDNKAINEKYSIELFSFDSDVKPLEKLNFKGKNTNIAEISKNVKQIYRNTQHPLVLFSDGNQTTGVDYTFNFQENTSVLPIVLGDTTTVLDVKIGQINGNKYAYFKNKFPVEFFLEYNGNQPITTDFLIQKGNQIVHKQKISFSKNTKVQTVQLFLTADQVGIAKYQAKLISNFNEKNKENNSKLFAVEIIDQRTEIALISSVNHPDLSTIKRSIENNQQRKVTLLKSNSVTSLQNYDVTIFYQPDSSFKNAYNLSELANKNKFIITGTKTDFNFLNAVQTDFKFEMLPQKENYAATFEPNFNLFSQENIGFENFPPLENKFGMITPKNNVSTLLYSSIRTIKTNNPLLSFSENGTKRSAYLFGENIWKWRLEHNLNKKSFDDFDILMDKIIQYLITSDSKKKLSVEHEKFYNSGDKIEILASYFNKNLEFDENAQLTIQVINSKTKVVKKYDFLKGNQNFKVNLDGLNSGQYAIKVTENQSNTTYSGKFEVLDFEIEKQFVNPDVSRLEQLASNTNGTLFYPNEIEKLINYLVITDKYVPIQKEIIKKSPLIDWTLLLILLVTFLTIEWFVRKYNGMV